MGGRRLKYRLSNVVWLESEINGLIESDPGWQVQAVARGIKIGGHDDPELVEVRHAVQGLVRLCNHTSTRYRAPSVPRRFGPRTPSHTSRSSRRIRQEAPLLR